LQVSEKEVRAQALTALKTGAPDYRVDLISLAIKGKKVSMTKVIKVVITYNNKHIQNLRNLCKLQKTTSLTV